MCTDCRHSQSQHKRTVHEPVIPVSQPASLTLLDILQEVPTLLRLLTPETQKALSAASRSFRQLFIAQVQVVTVNCEEDLALMHQNNWPLLSMVILHKRLCLTLPSMYKYTRLAGSVRILARAGSQLQCAIVFMLRPRQTLDSAWEITAAQQLAQQLMTAEWRELSSLTLTAVKPHALVTAIISQLSKGSWPSLRSLVLVSCRLSAQDCLLLSQGNWQALCSLELGSTCLDAECMAWLAKADWPVLERVCLSNNANLDAVGIAHLCTANWPLLRSLDLSGVPVSAAMAAELAKLHLPNMSKISLNNTGLTAAAMSALAQADWRSLTHLGVSWNDLDTTAMRHLCMMNLPALRNLQIQKANIASDGAYWLAQGSWPLLTDLWLQSNHLEAKDVKYLTSGVWPNLQSLWLGGNHLGFGGLQQLIKGDWSKLRMLSVSIDMPHTYNSLVLLGIEAAEVQRFDAARSLVVLHRAVSQAGRGLWPNLGKVMVYKQQ